MNYLIYALITVFTIWLSTFIGYLIPMTSKELKFKEYWRKCPQCEKTKSKKTVYNVFNFWKYGGYCEKHRVATWKNILFTLLFTVFSLAPFVLEFIFTGTVFTINSISLYIVSPMLIYATMTDFKGMVIPDACNIGIALTGLFVMFHKAITTGDNSVYLTHVIGMLCIALPFFLICLIGRGGFGDVKLFAALGLLLGWKYLLLVFFIAIISGCLYALYKKITAEDVKWKSELPFGPFICVGTYIAMLFGENIINSYLQLF